MNRTMCVRALLVCLPVAVAGSSALAQSKTLFSDNFEASTMKPQWTWAHLSKATAFSQFSGRYSNNTIKLQLDAPQGPRGGRSSSDGSSGGGDGGGGGGGGGDGGSGGGDGGGQTIDGIRYTLTFDFYAIDSWDGNDSRNGPDRFEINNGRTKLFSETFGNAWLDQTFRAPDVGRADMGYGRYTDAIYRKITVQWEQGLGEQVKLWFYDKGLQGVSDESWGIDNVEVKYEFVPAPASLPMLAMGGLLAGRRKRG